MITLNKLAKVFPRHYLVNRYLKQCDESWAKGRYYLGGQVPLYPDDKISYENILEVSNKLFVDISDVANSWELASIKRAESDFLEFQDLMNTYKRVVKYNGLLRAIVFWILPARKRATERVFHPNNLKFILDDNNELQLTHGRNKL